MGRGVVDSGLVCHARVWYVVTCCSGVYSNLHSDSMTRTLPTRRSHDPTSPNSQVCQRAQLSFVGHQSSTFSQLIGQIRQGDGRQNVFYNREPVTRRHLAVANFSQSLQLAPPDAH